MYQLLYQALKAYLLTTIPELKEIQLFKGKKPGKGHFVCTPVLQIQFLPTQTLNLGEGIQEAQVEFVAMLYTDNLADDDDKHQAPPLGVGGLEDGLTHLELVNKVNAALSGASFDLHQVPGFDAVEDTDDDLAIINTIGRTGIEMSTDLAWYLQTNQTFSGYARDFTASRKYAKVLAKITPEVTPTIDD